MLEYDVLVAGYGPTGAVAANLLGSKGLRVLVVEPNPEIFDIPRAVHFDGEVMRVFQSLGLADKIEQVSEPGNEIAFTNGRNWSLFQQDLTLVPRHHAWANNYFFNQPKLEARLREGVERYSNVDVAFGERVTALQEVGGGLSVDLVGEQSARQVRVAYLLGCDGANSTVRDLLHIEQENLDCDEPWFVCDWMIPNHVEIKRRAFQICDPARPTTLVPCAAGHIRWEFMVNDGESASLLEDEVKVRALMAPHVHRLSEKLDSNMGEVVRAKVYNFHALIADEFQNGRVFLLGDAAHQMPPFLGQGMCAGIRDAHNLCWKIAGVVSGEYSSAVLNTYTSERRPHVLEVIKTAIGHGGIIQNRSVVLSLLRDCFLKLGSIFPPLIKFLRFDLSWPLGEGLLASSVQDQADSPVGRMFPQYDFSDAGLGGGFALVVVDEGIKRDENSSRGIDCVSINELTADENARNALKSWFAKYNASAVVLRPDNYVYGYCSASAAAVDGLVSGLQRSLKAIAHSAQE